MSIQYSGSAHSTSFVASTKQDIINGIETALLAAGWTTISGHLTTNLVMKSATTPQGLAMRINVKDNGNTCAVVSIQGASGTPAALNGTANGAQLLPPDTFKVICNAYQAFVFTASPTGVRKFAAWGVPFVPSFLTPPSDLCWLMGNAVSDTDTSLKASFRNSPSSDSFSGLYPLTQAIIGTSVVIDSGVGNQSEGIALCTISLFNRVSSDLGVEAPPVWSDAEAILYDALIGWGINQTLAEQASRIRGQLWDACCIAAAVPGDTPTTFDTHNWIAVTDNYSGVANVYPPFCLLLATS